MLAMVVNDYAWYLVKRVVFTSIASMLAPTVGGRFCLSGRDSR
ncbi:hypothetical protein SAMN04490206_3591 [Pseudomonas umsongensis]|jgi:hypothetical protein|nr:hypothetical protein PG5_57440 [Pseudomonas sp. G5(2012)]SDT54077.1 hypothetical protein SAMN04490206_3591 [Pseudomonas umsongensis]